MGVIVECPKCHTKYSLDNASSQERRVRCKTCAGVFIVASGQTSLLQSGLEATKLSTQETGVMLPEGKFVALSAMDGPLRGRVFRLTIPRVVLGRSGSDIVVDDPEVSRRHCVLEVSGTSAVLVDLETTNGTYVNGKKVQRHHLQHLSEFRIGSTTFMFSVTDKYS